MNGVLLSYYQPTKVSVKIADKVSVATQITPTLALTFSSFDWEIFH